MPEYADILMRAVKPTVAGKVITIERSDATELRVALFPRLRNQSPKDFYPLLSKDEIAALLDFCTRAEVCLIGVLARRVVLTVSLVAFQASFPADNSLPFEHVCSLLQKFARMDSDKMTDIQRNAVVSLPGKDGGSLVIHPSLCSTIWASFQSTPCTINSLPNVAFTRVCSRACL